MFIIRQIKCSWLLPHRQAICFSSLIWLSRNKSVKKSRFSRIVKNSREFLFLDLDLEAFWFHFSLLEKEWKHFIFTLHFSKRVKAFCFHFSLLEFQKPTLAGPWYTCRLNWHSLHEWSQKSEKKDPIRTQNAKKVLIKDQVLKIRTLLETVYLHVLSTAT